MSELQEGNYTIPDGCVVKILRGAREISVRKKREKFHNYCRECEHQRHGRKSIQGQWWDSGYCAVKPKVIAGKGGYFYAAGDGQMACPKFSPKKKD